MKIACHPRRYRSGGGYSLLETIFVMMAITTLTTGLLVHSLSLFHRYALLQTTKRVEQTLLLAKHVSMMNHERHSIQFETNHYEFQGKHFDYYGTVLLERAQTVTYNQHGRISSATTLRFRCHRYEQTIVVWLGQGVYETSNIRIHDD